MGSMLDNPAMLREFVQQRFSNLFLEWNARKGTRDGLHASSILADETEFCYREHVLGAYYEREESIHSAQLLAIFLEGWELHELWQKLFSQDLSEQEREEFEQLLLDHLRNKQDEEAFETHIYEAESGEVDLEIEQCDQDVNTLTDERLRHKWQFLFNGVGSIADEVEKSHYDKEWGLSFTPDAIVRIQVGNENIQFIVEIKGYRDAAYKHMLTIKDPMKDADFKKAAVQANLYMYMLGIKQAIILVENKGNQQYRTWIRYYDEEMVKPYIERLQMIKKYIAVYRKREVPPKRICASVQDERAQKCPLRQACFASVEERKQLRKA